MTGPLDPAHDPDRYDPDAAPDPAAASLDPAQDPDRFDRTLPQMLGPGAHEDARDTWEWLYGLLAVLAFLAVVSLLITYL